VSASTPAAPCVHCGRVGGPHIRISRRDSNDNEIGSAVLCGTTCLAQWSYGICVQQGVRLVFAAQGVVSRIKSLFGR
jgi:hypothetical protein